MGASWVEVDRLIREVTALCKFPYARVLEGVMRTTPAATEDTVGDQERTR